MKTRSMPRLSSKRGISYRLRIYGIIDTGFAKRDESDDRNNRSNLERFMFREMLLVQKKKWTIKRRSLNSTRDRRY